MSELKHHPTLSEIQSYVQEVEISHNWDKDDVVQKCLMLGEEVGGPAKPLFMNYSWGEVGCKLRTVTGEINQIVNDVLFRSVLGLHV